MIGLGTNKDRGKDTVRVGAMRARARAPRIAFYVVVGILAVAGLRAALAPAEEAEPPARVVDRSADLAAWSFAEAFTRIYLTWEADGEAERERLLAPFLPTSLEADAGLRPASGTSQEVVWTAVTGAQRIGGRELVVVAARTTSSTLQLSVPIDRNDRGFLHVAGYPAIVGPPVVDEEAVLAGEQTIEDAKLEAVVARAVTNYLSGSRNNLLADLAPEAVVTLPEQPLEQISVEAVTWVVPGRRAAAEVEAHDADGTAMTLRYELGVRKSGRWFVSSLQVNPTYEGGS